MVYHDGYYYLTTTTWSDIQVARARTINELKTATFQTVWKDTTASRCCNMWAPELHRVDGRWHLYYTAGPSGSDYSKTQKTWVLQGGTNHPMEPYTFLSEVNVGFPNLDSSVYQIGSKNYYLTCAWGSDGQSVYIAELLSPGRIGPVTKISSPTYSWEKQKWGVNEGPIGLTGPTGRNFIFFSSSSCETTYYSLGYIELTPGANPLSASSWKKNPNVQFQSGNGMYGPGHNGFFKSPSGKEDWIVYHANNSPQGTCDGNRRTNVQKVNWNSDGTPNLGSPVGENVQIAEPQ
ncbi:Arabinanase/levansucrase/invertase [Ascobolus immersus RN42]|uniref:Arabinanase/levansucrase/invertase n=1 Tax=Ascobolus immersus RN42 TaxID=1160509 RepID=A0A3N4HZC8_ASCIM|nr:Arabinanase/levansucrase/invertase [Ascobolus immersus RN42]